MSVETTKKILHEELEKCECRRIRTPKLHEMWAKEEGDVVPFFAPSIVAKGGGNTQILGVLGLHIAGFEQYWYDLVKKYYPPDMRSNGFVLSAYITNFQEFIDPPYIPNSPSEASLIVNGWVESIIRFLNSFPTSIELLLQGLEKGLVGRYRFGMFQGDWVKWLAFVHWLRSNNYDCPDAIIELHRDRNTHRYHEIYRELFTE